MHGAQREGAAAVARYSEARSLARCEQMKLPRPGESLYLCYKCTRIIIGVQNSDAASIVEVSAVHSLLLSDIAARRE